MQGGDRVSKRFRPTSEQRNTVEAMIGFGIPEPEICRLIKNPETRKPIAEKTLRQAFTAEIDTGQTKANAQVGKFIYATITGTTGGITDERARAQLAIFWARTRMGWKMTVSNEQPGPGGAVAPVVVILPDNGRDGARKV
jgi:hypothetical protein